MISLTVSVDNKLGIEGMILGLNKQLPYAISLAINNTVDVAQRAIQAKLPSEFVLRRNAFMLNTIYRKPGEDFATKTNFVGTVRVNPDRNFFAKFEDGGTKTATGGAHTMPVPVVRQDDPSLIFMRSDPLYIKNVFLALAATQGRMIRPKKSGALKLMQQNRLFLVRKGGKAFIVQRIGENETRVIYAFETAVGIKPQLHFDDTAMAAAVADFNAEFTRALDYAARTAI